MFDQLPENIVRANNDTATAFFHESPTGQQVVLVFNGHTLAGSNMGDQNKNK